MSDAAQAEVLAFLADPHTYGLGSGAVTRCRTHISELFLAGDRAYKVKRAVRYAFVDFSTLEARRAACAAEVRLNRRTAPDIYLGTAAVRRTAEGRLRLDEPGQAGPGEPVEWLVVMRRFDGDMTFDRLAERDALEPDWIDALADAIIDLHESAEIAGAPYGGRDGLKRVIDENARDMAALGDLLDPVRVRSLIAAQRALLDAHAPLLDARRAAGQVRRCHGDLHLGNVVLWHGRPTLFDCIEFSDAIALIDVAYDLAFLLMDLEVRGFRPLANRALCRYLGRRGGVEMLAALPLMMSLRAAVRCKVTAMAVAGLGDAAEIARRTRQAEALLGAAERFAAQAPPPCLIAVGGLSGTGKTSLAMALAPALGRAPGALVLRSDIIRKRLAQVPPEQRLPAESYTPEANRQVYETLTREAETALVAGQSVITDAVFGREAERRAIEAVAAAAGIRFLGLWLEAAAPVLKERVAQRTRDASDATPAVVGRQLNMDVGSITWRRLNASAAPDAVLTDAIAALPDACRRRA